MYDAELEGQTSDLTTCLVNAPPSRTLQTKLTFMTTKKETKYYMNVVFKVLSEISSWMAHCQAQLETEDFFNAFFWPKFLQLKL